MVAFVCAFIFLCCGLAGGCHRLQHQLPGEFLIVYKWNLIATCPAVFTYSFFMGIQAEYDSTPTQSLHNSSTLTMALALSDLLAQETRFESLLCLIVCWFIFLEQAGELRIIIL